MNTKAPRFNNYDDVIKAIEAAQSNDALSDLAAQVDAEYSNGRLDLTLDNWGDFASRTVIRNDQLTELQTAAASPVQDSPVSVIASYVSVWDGSVNLETPCVIDLATGLVEAALVDSTGLASCDLEFVRLSDGKEFEVTAGEGMIADLEAFQQAAKALTSAGPVDPVLLAIEVLQALRPDLAAAVQALVDKAEAACSAPSEPAAPVVVIETGGGLIKCIRSSAPVEIIQLEEDVDDGDPESQILVTVGSLDYELSVRQFREEVTGGREGVDVWFCNLVREQAASKLAEHA